MSSFKTGITVHLNTLLLEKLSNMTNVSAYVDEVLSGYFGITYKEAYPECNEGRWQ